MGNSSSARPNGAGMTADEIEKYYDAIAKHDEVLNDNDDRKEPDDTNSSLANASSEIIRSTGVAPDDRVAATARLDEALQAIAARNIGEFNQAVGSLVKLGININHLAKVTLERVKAYPWETAAIVVPLILLACTPAILGAVGFTAAGIAAGSIAAGIQAGIGNVAAGSSFAILTSAAMGGYGAIIVFGSVLAVPAVALVTIGAWWRRRTERGG